MLRRRNTNLKHVIGLTSAILIKGMRYHAYMHVYGKTKRIRNKYKNAIIRECVIKGNDKSYIDDVVYNSCIYVLHSIASVC
ncbi:MAG: hypothetical protein ACRCXT_18915 [Paraclostridium sp.]